MWLGPRVPTYTMSSLSQLSVLENVHDRGTLMPPDLSVPGWEQHPGNQERGAGGRVGAGRAVPKGEMGRPVVPWHDRERVAGRPPLLLTMHPESVLSKALPCFNEQMTAPACI